MLINKIIKNITYPLWMLLDGNAPGIKYLHAYEDYNRLSLDEILARQKDNLKNIITHAYNTVPYYRELFNKYDFNISTFTEKDFQNLPFITKETVRNNYDQLISTEIYNQDLFPASTGGSTGTPMHFLRDKLCLYKRKGQELFFDRWMGYEIGDKTALFVAASHHTNITNKIKHHIRNMTSDRMIRFDPSQINKFYVREFLLLFNRFKPDIIKSFPNSLTAFSELVQELDLKPVNVKSISCTGENLYQDQIDLFKSLYNSEIFEKYGTKECGVISAECPVHCGQHIFTDGVYMEILDYSGTPISPGSTGRIIVTDLYNYGMPLIRYDIGDMAVQSDNSPCGCGVNLPKIRQIIGRDRDIIIDREGNPKPGYLFVEIINKYNLPGKFQIIQHMDKGLEIKIENHCPSYIGDLLVKNIQKIIGNEINIQINIVNVIPREPSGKYAYVKSEIRKT